MRGAFPPCPIDLRASWPELARLISQRNPLEDFRVFLRRIGKAGRRCNPLLHLDGLAPSPQTVLRTPAPRQKWFTRASPSRQCCCSWSLFGCFSAWRSALRRVWRWCGVAHSSRAEGEPLQTSRVARRGAARRCASTLRRRLSSVNPAKIHVLANRTGLESTGLESILSDPDRGRRNHSPSRDLRRRWR